ncbi:inosine 5'-monophosphate dehydrogenase [Candidatus Omnitrophus magneticus]|uniref:Inosine 5'-monophosphate dehydrogenase n=1 Tax=Candidatus Omnitrophus magneticus TaxID=1609969 RepID=A0A0F0CRX2_9BACT|nr:inosine 5'-monophosphate dehydrogenase [Candidatus Omnitrophus magneticus]
MGMWIGMGRKARRSYGFDEIALVPGELTINPNDVDTSCEIGGVKFNIPIMASSMDGVVDVNFAIAMGKLGGVAVLHLEGISTRYENPEEAVKRIISCEAKDATKIIQEVYSKPIKTELISKRVSQIKAAKVPVVVSCNPQVASTFGPIAREAGCDIFIVQSTVISVRHESSEYKPLDLYKFCKDMQIPVLYGNSVDYNVALAVMDTGCQGIFVGIGPGTACTSRGVLGIGVPQITATCDTAAARDFYYKKTGRYVPVITDGGMATGGDICKAFASGADAVMLGNAFARCKEAPGKGYHWGMAMPHPSLPRGTRIQVGTTGTLEEVLFGPAQTDDGTQNLMGALATSMGNLGAHNIREMQLVRMIIAPSIQTEGKVYQSAQRVGMRK